MPARRDMQTGRLSFLHRSWGPLEPFDNSFPELLNEAGIYSHLITDHFHYWEDGGATYHNRYDCYEFIRGQEGDPWKAMVQPHWERLREMYHERQFSEALRDYKRHNIVNREFIKEEKDFPSVQCFRAGFEFLDRNRAADGWLLQIETFDPHEPFQAPPRFRDKFRTGWNGPIRDWPRYGRVDELPEECEELRANYYAVVSLCDFLIGELLDYFDAHDLWKDTALVVTTDHGFLLGEHDFWAKNRMNMYEEIVHIPLFVHDPRRAGGAGARRDRLTQTIDLAPTFLDLFGVASPPEMQGHSLLPLLDARTAAAHGRPVRLFRRRRERDRRALFVPPLPARPEAQELYQYTLMPTHIWDHFPPDELAGASLAGPFPFTKGTPVLKVPVTSRSPMYKQLWPRRAPGGRDAALRPEARSGPGALRFPIRRSRRVWPAVMRELMAANDAPAEAFRRLELDVVPA